MIRPDDNDLTSWSRSARGRGYEDGFKGRPQQARFLNDVPLAVRDAYIQGHAEGSARHDAIAAFKRTHGKRPSF